MYGIRCSSSCAFILIFLIGVWKRYRAPLSDDYAANHSAAPSKAASPVSLKLSYFHLLEACHHTLAYVVHFVQPLYCLTDYCTTVYTVYTLYTGWFRLNAQNCVPGNSSRRFCELYHEILHTYSGRQYLKLEEGFFFIWGFAVEISGFRPQPGTPNNRPPRQKIKKIKLFEF